MVNAGSVIASIILCLLGLRSAQAQTWQHFSPPGRSFVIEVPGKPETLKDEDSLVWLSRDKKNAYGFFKHVKSGLGYSLKLGIEKDPELIIAVLHMSQHVTDREFDSTVNSSILWMFGDDKVFSKQTDVVIEGLHGREFVFDKGSLRGRALFVNGGRQIYMLSVSSEAEEAIFSNAVSRTFDTFRPLK